jgi:AcrR family transcriptional regulator
MVIQGTPHSVDSEARTDRRRLRTRKALLEAGRALFASRSIEGVSIDDIVAAAQVAKGSFYNHFPDKEALAAEIALEIRAEVERFAAVLNAGVADPAERVARAVCGFARQAADEPLPVRAMLRLFPGAGVPDAPMNAGVRADIQAGLAQGRFSGLRLEAGVLISIGVAQMAVSRILDHDSPAGAATLARDLAFGLLRGLGLDAAEAKGVAVAAASAIFSAPPMPGGRPISS